MHEEAQAAARQRLQLQQQQQQQIQPVQAQGMLAEMAESMRLADEGELSPQEVRARICNPTGAGSTVSPRANR